MWPLTSNVTALLGNLKPAPPCVLLRPTAPKARIRDSRRFSLDHRLLSTGRRLGVAAFDGGASAAVSTTLYPFTSSDEESSPPTPSTPKAQASKHVQQQVTRHNFEAVLPEVKAALEECSFFAWDCEFSGLSGEAPSMAEQYDDASDRYQRIFKSAQQFLVMQFGLSVFNRCSTTGTYTCRTFNFWVFPKPSGACNLRFMCQASSLEFLASKGFDFNRFIYDGIPFTPLHSPVLIPHNTTMHVPLHVQLQGQQNANAASASPAAGTTTSVQQRQQDSETTYDRTAPEEAAAQSSPHPSSSASSSEASTGSSNSNSVEAAGATGFSQVLELMRACGRPAVAHNGLADLAYTLQQFVCPLPRQWEDFKTLARSWFTGGIYDTKVVASQLLADPSKQGLLGDLSLGQLYSALQPEGTVEKFLEARQAVLLPAGEPLLPAVEHAAGFDLYRDVPACSTAGKVGMEGEAGMGPSSTGARPDGMAHEAGYDAYMTGCIFARLLRVAELTKDDRASSGSMASTSASASIPTDSDTTSTSTAAHPSVSAACGTFPELRWAEPWAGRLHSMRSDLPYLDLHGPDPVPQRPDVFHISNLNVYTKPSHIAAKFFEAGLGKVRVAMLVPQSEPARGQNGQPTSSGKSAFVHILSSENTPRVLTAVRSMNAAWRAVRYAEYHTAKHRPAPSAQQQQQQPKAVKAAAAAAGSTTEAPAGPRPQPQTAELAAGYQKNTQKPFAQQPQQQHRQQQYQQQNRQQQQQQPARAPPKRESSKVQLRQVPGAPTGSTNVIHAVMVTVSSSSPSKSKIAVPVSMPRPADRAPSHSSPPSPPQSPSTLLNATTPSTPSNGDACTASEEISACSTRHVVPAATAPQAEDESTTGARPEAMHSASCSNASSPVSESPLQQSTQSAGSGSSQHQKNSEPEAHALDLDAVPMSRNSGEMDELHLALAARIQSLAAALAEDGLQGPGAAAPAPLSPSLSSVLRVPVGC